MEEHTMQPYEREAGIGGIAIFVIIALIAVLGGGIFYMTGKSKTNTAPQENVTNSVTVTSEAPTPTGIVSADTSDTGLSKDSADVDTKLKAADQDSTNVDAGLNDQQGNLSEQ